MKIDQPKREEQKENSKLNNPFKKKEAENAKSENVEYPKVQNVFAK